MKELPVAFTVTTSLADYYTVGASKLITVSVRYSCGKYLCHTCCVNKCEHTEAVRAYRDEHGSPVEVLPVPDEPKSALGISLEWVEL